MNPDPSGGSLLDRLEDRVRTRILSFLARVIPDSDRVAQRARWRAEPFPDDWRRYLTEHVPRYAALTDAQRHELESQIQVFLNEKRFEGAGGLELTDEIRVTIAAQACLLSLARDLDYFPRLRVILVYPETYLARYARFSSPQPHHEDVDPRAGESWVNGVVVLSWNGVRDGSAALGRFRNVVAHEFAHQLDQEDGTADGIPLVDGSAEWRTWARRIAVEYDRHAAALENGEATVLDPYGGTNRAEFFAVAVEAFLERPVDLRADRPDLYDLLREYFGQDPAAG